MGFQLQKSLLTLWPSGDFDLHFTAMMVLSLLYRSGLNILDGKNQKELRRKNPRDCKQKTQREAGFFVYLHGVSK